MDVTLYCTPPLRTADVPTYDVIDDLESTTPTSFTAPSLAISYVISPMANLSPTTESESSVKDIDMVKIVVITSATIRILVNLMKSPDRNPKDGI